MRAPRQHREVEGRLIAIWRAGKYFVITMMDMHTPCIQHIIIKSTSLYINSREKSRIQNGS
jgi:hypothetical protein